MSVTAERVPTIGDNNPPAISAILADNYAHLYDEVEALARAANSAPKKIVDEGSGASVVAVRKDAAAFFKKVDGLRVQEKEPHLKASRDVDDFFRPLTERAERIRKHFLGIEDDRARELAAEERRRREDEARKAREEAARQLEIAQRQAAAARPVAAAKAEDKAEAATDLAEKLETAPIQIEDAKSEWAFRIVDIDKVDLNSLRAFIATDIVEKALRAHTRLHKGSRPITGVEFFEDFKAKRR